MDGNFLEKVEKFKLPIALSLLGIVLIIGGIFASGLNEQVPSFGSKQKIKEYPKESLVQTQKTISVDVSGAVLKPGVYQLNEGSRIEDSIKAAGGFSDDSNKEYISKYLNMAQKLSDGTKIYVPLDGEMTVNTSGGTSAAGASTQSKLNINTSSQSELETLSGIGPVTASKIISARPYQSIDELTSKKIVSKAVFEKIKDSLVTY